ncbi:hypothetical protein RFI_35987 [Reticulomyxa filosa]|uniref:Uncharacterized protein n=1 Tax=Reticulomyxa filosa TaxID=46433 RepID=X6LHN5_RETFI|nr:hypothetical protein RFI_35987 [Reticulomyxa filosa]|eukprot:ETO01453.1 hypothetical protein RFI_35987 [Reticulomyxa filosa]
MYVIELKLNTNCIIINMLLNQYACSNINRRNNMKKIQRHQQLNQQIKELKDQNKQLKLNDSSTFVHRPYSIVIEEIMLQNQIPKPNNTFTCNLIECTKEKDLLYCKIEELNETIDKYKYIVTAINTCCELAPETKKENI